MFRNDSFYRIVTTFSSLRDLPKGQTTQRAPHASRAPCALVTPAAREALSASSRREHGYANVFARCAVLAVTAMSRQLVYDAARELLDNRIGSTVMAIQRRPGT
jgi:hypothetical protein